MKATVVLDPGHGGTDSGCSFSGLKEKDLVLSIARRVRALSQALPDLHFQVELTRDEDRNLGLQEAADRAKALGASMVIALHIDALEKGTARGLWAAVVPGELLSGGSKARAEILLKHIPIALRGKRGPLAEATNAPGPEDDWLKRCRNVLMPHMKVAPAFLVELGYITNEKDRLFLSSAAGQSELAVNIIAALCEIYHA